MTGWSESDPNLSPAYTNSSSYMSGVRLVGQHGEIRTGPQISLHLCGLSVQSERGQGQTNLRVLADIKCKGTRYDDQTDLPSPAADVPDSVIYSHREASPPRSTPHQTHTVALGKRIGGYQSHKKR